MPATTLKLSAELKDRVKAATDGTGKSPHAFMRTGKAYALEDVREYFAARIAGKPARKPRFKRWRM